MPIAAVRVLPVGPEILPEGGGLVREVWRLTGDGATAAVTITPDIVKKIYAVYGNGASNNLTATPGSVAASVTFTFLANVGNGVKHDVELVGKV